MSTITKTLTWPLSFFYSIENCLQNFEKQKEKIGEDLKEEIDLLIGLVVKSVLFSDPTKKDFDKSDFERILGNDKKKFRGKKSSFELIKKIVEEYHENTKSKWKNVHWYSPFCSWFDLNPNRYKKENYLFEFAKKLNNSLIVSTREKTDEFWVGKNNESNNVQVLGKIERGDNFEVISSKEHLLLFLNKEDFNELEIGITKKIKGFEQLIKLDLLREKVCDIIPVGEIKSGYARLVDKRAFKISPLFKDVPNIEVNLEDSGIRIDTSAKFFVAISDHFVGCLFSPRKEKIKKFFYICLKCFWTLKKRF